MSHLLNRQWLLASRPQGSLKLTDFEWHEDASPPPVLEHGELRVHNRFFLCAPTMRNFLNALGRSYCASNAAAAAADVGRKAGPIARVAWSLVEKLATSRVPS